MSNTNSASHLPRIGVLGAGHVGSAMGRVASEAGYPVTIAGSGDPAKIALITKILIPGAQADWPAKVAADADIVILAIPLHKFRSFDPSLVAGKVVVDLMNYWAPIDGTQQLFEDPRHGSSEIVQQHLSGARVVKSFNHAGYHELEADRRPAGAADRLALGVAGDDRKAVEMVAALVENIGYDAVLLDGLHEGRILEPGGPVFGASLNKEQFAQVLTEKTAA
ncbi:NADPH-dependent F420 reductase [Arthrobacter zhaoguopingii]|uniref:NADPH-dependent F420 reductase n=1 Tax=Arthrobacter zhaoguopingii TaxID=2681491 RepID=UPI001356EEAA|nr:NADPH-dependent F420 reductase [Arthrobacter zhaoguopingii]